MRTRSARTPTWGAAPIWSNFLLAVSVFAIYFTLPRIALSALSVYQDAYGNWVSKLGLTPDQGGFQNDPVPGIVENLGLDGSLLSVIEICFGALAAAILSSATNAGVSGASYITYSMSSYRQLPEVLRRLDPKFKTPWPSPIVFAGVSSILVIIPGWTSFLGNRYAFGAMLSFTIAHFSVIALRIRQPDHDLVSGPSRTSASAGSSGRCSRSSAASAPSSPGSSS